MSIVMGAVQLKNVYLRYACIVAGAVGAGFLGKKLDKHIKSFGTALIGSYLLIRGLGNYGALGKYPSESRLEAQAANGNLNYDTSVWAYIATFVFFVVAGSYVQLKHIKSEDTKKDDAFANEDEAKVCGCF
jgi:hypothetical protein